MTAYGCKLSLEYGFDGVVAFDAKTALIPHYEKTLGAVRIGQKRMAVMEDKAILLLEKYFPETLEVIMKLRFMFDLTVRLFNRTKWRLL